MKNKITRPDMVYRIDRWIGINTITITMLHSNIATIKQIERKKSKFTHQYGYWCIHCEAIAIRTTPNFQSFNSVLSEYLSW
jgi:hypothetical protein